MSKYLALLILSASAAFAIDGTVQNGTTGQPQPGASLSLFRISQTGPELVATSKSGADGSFQLTVPAGQDSPGPRLLQANFDGVTYNKMIVPGAPTSHVQLDVYRSSAQPGAASIATHMMILEPSAGQLAISESFVYNNPSKITYNNNQTGTVRFYLPPATKGKVDVSVLAPGSVSIRSSAQRTDKPDIYQINFPVKPGESRIDLTYGMPFTTPGTFVTKEFVRSTNLKVLAPPGVTLGAPGIQNLGQEPRTQATVYGIDGADLRIDVQGNGSLRGNENADSAQNTDSNNGGGSALAELMPQLYSKANPADGFLAAAGSVKWLLLLAFGMLALCFAYLYRKPGPNERKL